MRADALALDSVEVVVGLEQLGEAEHRVERRAQLVAHAREELALRPVRALGLLACAQQLLGAAAALADVLDVGQQPRLGRRGRRASPTSSRAPRRRGRPCAGGASRPRTCGARRAAARRMASSSPPRSSGWISSSGPSDRAARPRRSRAARRARALTRSKRPLGRRRSHMPIGASSKARRKCSRAASSASTARLVSVMSRVADWMPTGRERWSRTTRAIALDPEAGAVLALQAVGDAHGLHALEQPLVALAARRRGRPGGRARRRRGRRARRRASRSAARPRSTRR